MATFKALGIFALALIFLSGLSDAREGVMLKGAERFYIDCLDMVEYQDGLFNVFFYNSLDFDSFDVCQVRRLRASKSGVYFIDKDIVRLLHQPDHTDPRLTQPEPFSEENR